MKNPYRAYFLASQKNLELGETVGVTAEQWDLNQKQLSDAERICLQLESWFDCECNKNKENEPKDDD